jgi:hypothetical protein
MKQSMDHRRLAAVESGALHHSFLSAKREAQWDAMVAS